MVFALLPTTPMNTMISTHITPYMHMITQTTKKTTITATHKLVLSIDLATHTSNGTYLPTSQDTNLETGTKVYLDAHHHRLLIVRNNTNHVNAMDFKVNERYVESLTITRPRVSSCSSSRKLFNNSTLIPSQRSESTLSIRTIRHTIQHQLLFACFKTPISFLLTLLPTPY